MSTTEVSRYLRAPRSRVYAALLDPAAIANWKVPAQMRCQVHSFDARVGGRFRVSLTYDEPAAHGKSGANTDTYHGRFLELSENERVVEAMSFESADPAMQGEMIVTTTLTEADGGTLLRAVHAQLPPGVSVEDNDTGWREALDRLARLVEQG